jgi:hypothetical protein
MAEYQITSEELLEFINKSIESIPEEDDRDKMREYRTEIMCVLTGDFSDGSEKEIQSQLMLWSNRLSNPTQFIMRNRVIRLKDCILAVVGLAIETGALEVIANRNSFDVTTGVAIAAGAAWSIYNWLQSVSSLDARDCCVYLQLLKHSVSKDSAFSEAEVSDWYAGSGDKCMIEKRDWNCYYFEVDGCCSFIKRDGISDSLFSLTEKKLLKCENSSQTKMYSLRSIRKG